MLFIIYEQTFIVKGTVGKKMKTANMHVDQNVNFLASFAAFYSFSNTISFFKIMC